MVVRANVEVCAVDQETESCAELTSRPFVSVMLVRPPVADVSRTGADTILMPLQGVEVNRASEVRREELVALVRQALPISSQLREFGGAGSESFVKRRLDLCCQIGVLGLSDCDVLVAVGYELLKDSDRDSATGAVLPIRCAPGADVARVADTLFVCGEIELHPRLAGATEQRVLEVMIMSPATFGRDPAGVEEPLPPAPSVDVDQQFVCAGLFSTLIADDANVVRVAQHPEEPRARHGAGGTLRCRALS